MRVEFHGNGFMADMNDCSEYKGNNKYELSSFINRNKTLIFGLISLFLSLINLPFGLFINLSRRVLEGFDGVSAAWWITVLAVMTAIFSIFSVAAGIASVLAYSKSEKSSSNVAGLISSIISFAVCIIALVLTVIGIFA